MNCTSAGETGGSVARVVGGRVRVGFPGAPGWTTTGFDGVACCAKTCNENRLTRVLADASTHEYTATPNTTRISEVHLNLRGLTRRKYLSILELTLSHLAASSHSFGASEQDFRSVGRVTRIVVLICELARLLIPLN